TQVTLRPLGRERLAFAIRSLSPAVTDQTGRSNSWLWPGSSADGTQDDKSSESPASVKIGVPVATHLAPAVIGIPSPFTPRSRLMVPLASSAPLAVSAPVAGNTKKKKTAASSRDKRTLGPAELDRELRNCHRPTQTIFTASLRTLLAQSCSVQSG